jgi:hypothetical protein
MELALLVCLNSVQQSLETLFKNQGFKGWALFHQIEA